MPATVRNVQPDRAARDQAPDPRRRWALAATEITTDESSLFAGDAPPSRVRAARPAPAPAPSPLPNTTPPPPAMPDPVPFPTRAARPVPAWRLSLIGAGALVGVLAIYAILSALFTFVQVKADDITYGRPRTTQLDGYFGHAGEQDGQPSHILALNLARRIVLIELPGGDTQGASTITGPYLFGANEDLTPVQLQTADINGDGNPDLVVDVKNEQLVYINDRDKNSFHLITAEERSRLAPPNASQGGGAPADGGQR